MAKRDTGFGNARYEDEEELFLRQCAIICGLSNSDFMRKCAALAAPILVSNPYARRVELKDTIDGMQDAVNYLLHNRNSKV